MTRIERGYGCRIQSLLEVARVRRADRLADRLRRTAYERVRTAVLGRVGSRAVRASFGLTDEIDLRFLADASLGGVARWLRAFGYEVEVARPAAIDRLLEQARGRVFLGSDVGLFDRRVVRLREAAAVWVPSSLDRLAQFRLIRDDLSLTRRAGRCMRCGGKLVGKPKDEVFERIPPRTARWKDDFFECAGCGGLFWEGTHWERIVREMGA